MPSLVNNHLIVREVGTPWLATLEAPSDTTMVLMQDEEEPDEVAERVSRRVQKYTGGKERLRSAVIACNDKHDAWALKLRYRMARDVLRHMAVAGAGTLQLALDHTGGPRALESLMAMARVLVSEVRGHNLGLSVRHGANIVSLA